MNRPAGSLSPLYFGRRQPFSHALSLPSRTPVSQELKLFATTYAAGFLLVSLFIA